MSRKRNHRMRQRPANCAALENAIYNNSPTPAAEVTRVMAAVRLSYEKLKLGTGTSEDLLHVQSALNVGMVRAESIDPEVVRMFVAAGEALVECERIRRRSGRYGFTGPHILAMNAAMDLYEQMLTLSTPNQLHAAATEADRRIRAGNVVTA